MTSDWHLRRCRVSEQLLGTDKSNTLSLGLFEVPAYKAIPDKVTTL